MNNRYANFFKEQFKIKNKQGVIVPLAANKIQMHFLNNLAPRMIILKPRQVGISAIILALGTSIFLSDDNAVCVTVSHETDATQRLLEKAELYLKSYAQTNDPDATDYDYKRHTKSLLESAVNGSKYFIGTANKKAFGRGDTIKFLHFSEIAYYAEKTFDTMVLGAMNAVPDVTIDADTFIIWESTANGEGKFKDAWDDAVAGKTPFVPVFFPASMFYSPEFLASKRAEINNDKLFKQEYPETPEEAFIVSGTPYFDAGNVKGLQNTAMNVKIKYLTDIDVQGGLYNTAFDVVQQNDEKVWRSYPKFKVWREPDQGEQIVMGGDPAEGYDFNSGVWKSKQRADTVVTYNNQIESVQFANDIYHMGQWLYNRTGSWPTVAIERNKGTACINQLQRLNYPDIWRMTPIGEIEQNPNSEYGFYTTELSRRFILENLLNSINDHNNAIFDLETIQQLLSFLIINGKPQARSGKKDDLVIAEAIAWHLFLMIPTFIKKETPSWYNQDKFNQPVRRGY